MYQYLQCVLTNNIIMLKSFKEGNMYRQMSKKQTTYKGPRCFLEQETLPLLLSTGWFQERIRAWFHNRTKINWGHYGRLTSMSNKPHSLNIVNTKQNKCLKYKNTENKTTKLSVLYTFTFKTYIRETCSYWAIQVTGILIRVR